MFRLAVVGALLLALVVALPASAQMTRGAISGTVRDATGAVVPGASVTVINMATNASRTAISDSQGFYRVAGLEPGNYAVKAELAGFSTVEQKDVPVKTASEATLGIEMKVAVTPETITVTGRASAVELNKTNATLGITSSTRQVTELPLGGAGRNINNLILLTPNVVSTTGQGNFAVNGQRSRNNNFMIDGTDNNDISVTIATSQIVPEAVAEFQTLTNAYSVEFGRNTGAQVNVITKSGTNSFHGEAWDYYTTNELYSLNNIEKASGLEKPAKFNRHQLGFSVGGPIVKDKTFFFALYQHDMLRPGTRPGGTVRVLTPEGLAALNNVPLGPGQTPASRAAVLQQLQFLNNVYGESGAFRSPAVSLVNGIPIGTAQTNVNIVDPSTYKSPLFRIDQRIGANDNLTARYSYNGRVDDNAISNCNFGPLFCGSQDLKDTNVSISESHTFNAAMLNEARFSLVRRDLNFPENDPDAPTATISGLFQIGGDSNFPQYRVSDAYQFTNTLTWMKNRHTFKFGADIRYNKLDNFSAFNSKGVFAFNSLQDYMNNSASTFTLALQTSSFVAKQWQSFFFVQDDFRVNSDLTLNLGLRYELSGVPLGFFGATDPQSLGALVPGPVKKDTNNFAPRVGFAWSPRSDSKLLGNGQTVIRGGYGIGYDVLFYNLLVVNASNFPRIATLTLNNVQNVYPNLISGSATPTFSPLLTYTNSAVDTQNPLAHFWSLSIQREISDFVVELSYSGSRNFHGINQQQANPAVLTAAQIATVQATRNANSIPSVQARRLDPNIGSRTLIPSDFGPNGVDAEARSHYDAAVVSVQKRLSHGIQLGAAYTYSKWNSNNDASLGEGGTDAASQRAQNYFDIESEWSPSAFDRTHRFAGNWLWELPGPKSGAMRQVLGGWQFSGTFQAQSGQPFTLQTGVDSNGDGNTGSDRPNVNPNGTFTWDDDHKTFTNPLVGGKYTTPLGTNGLPLQNAQGDGNAARNSERAAPFYITDLTMLKRFYIGHSNQLVIRADVFNAFNQDNYGLPVVTMTSASFGQNTRNWGRRSVLLSAKFVF